MAACAVEGEGAGGPISMEMLSLVEEKERESSEKDAITKILIKFGLKE